MIKNVEKACGGMHSQCTWTNIYDNAKSWEDDRTIELIYTMKKHVITMTK